MPDTSPGNKSAAYGAVTTVLQGQSVTARQQLAASPDTQPEVLYYLVDDDSQDVRLAVAGNQATPPQANIRLAEDADDDVRSELARKIGRLMPDLRESRQARLRDLTIEAIETLSMDQLPQVRSALSESIKAIDNVPKDVILRLAKDVEEIVAVPVLEYSPLLNDADLVELIAAGVTMGALPAIARRNGLSAEVSQSVVASADMPSIAALLHNKSANVHEETLDKIASEARYVEEIHEPLTLRPELSQRAIRRLSTFISRALLENLSERSGLDNRTRKALAEAVNERLVDDASADDKLDAGFADHLAATGKLDDEVIQSAIEKSRRGFVVHALALMAKRSDAWVERILELHNGKATTAMVHQAGLSMRTALMVQQRIAKVPPSQILPARNGVDYPLTPEQMEMQIAHIPD